MTSPTSDIRFPNAPVLRGHHFVTPDGEQDPSGPSDESQYPPAKPGALDMWPLKAAGPDLKPHLCGPAHEILSRYATSTTIQLFSATFGEQLPRDTYIPTLRGYGFKLSIVNFLSCAWWLAI